MKNKERSERIRKILIENDNLSTKQIMNILIEKNPQILEDKIAFYADAGKEKSDSWVINQLRAEIASALDPWVKKGKITLGKENGIITYTATEFFKKQITSEQVIGNESELDDEYDSIDFDSDSCDDKVGINYFLISEICPNISKIGETTDLERRMYELSKHKTYGAFKLKVKGYIVVKNCKKVETMFHNYFNQYRLYPDNSSIKIRTELFDTDFDLYELWKNFIIINYLNNPIMKNEILEYKF
jgi:hypothetical protein